MVYFGTYELFRIALHEDVQKVTSKPRITKEAESAREAWSQYTSRENSQIVDLCVGQLKSSLTCSHCGYVSNVRPELSAWKILGTIIFDRTFINWVFQVWDPFWDLSVPLPSGARNVEDCLEEFRKEEVEIRCLNAFTENLISDARWQWETKMWKMQRASAHEKEVWCRKGSKSPCDTFETIWRFIGLFKE